MFKNSWRVWVTNMAYDKIKFYSFGGARKEKLVGALRLIHKCDGRVVLALLFGIVTRRTRVRDIDTAAHLVTSLSFNELLELGLGSSRS